MSFEELRNLCVERFPESSSRAALWKNFEQAYEEIISCGLCGELWIDGSFLTEKKEPKDIDLVLRAYGDQYDNGTEEQFDVIDWIDCRDRYEDKGLDTFVIFDYPDGPEELTLAGIEAMKHWERIWGKSWRGVPTGFAVLKLRKYRKQGLGCFLRGYAHHSTWVDGGLTQVDFGHEWNRCHPI